MQGKLITTANEIIELANLKKSVIVRGVRLPASSLLYRTFKDTITLINDSSIYEYIKESNSKPIWKTTVFCRGDKVLYLVNGIDGNNNIEGIVQNILDNTEYPIEVLLNNCNIQYFNNKGELWKGHGIALIKI